MEQLAVTLDPKQMILRGERTRFLSLNQPTGKCGRSKTAIRSISSMPRITLKDSRRFPYAIRVSEIGGQRRCGGDAISLEVPLLEHSLEPPITFAGRKFGTWLPGEWLLRMKF